jgi:hypothetical protein
LLLLNVLVEDVGGAVMDHINIGVGQQFGIAPIDTLDIQLLGDGPGFRECSARNRNDIRITQASNRLYVLRPDEPPPMMPARNLYIDALLIQARRIPGSS